MVDAICHVCCGLLNVKRHRFTVCHCGAYLFGDAIDPKVYEDWHAPVRWPVTKWWESRELLLDAGYEVAEVAEA